MNEVQELSLALPPRSVLPRAPMRVLPALHLRPCLDNVSFVEPPKLDRKGNSSSLQSPSAASTRASSVASTRGPSVESAFSRCSHLSSDDGSLSSRSHRPSRSSSIRSRRYCQSEESGVSYGALTARVSLSARAPSAAAICSARAPLNNVTARAPSADVICSGRAPLSARELREPALASTCITRAPLSARTSTETRITQCQGSETSGLDVTRAPLSARTSADTRITRCQGSETSGLDVTRVVKPRDPPKPRQQRPYRKQLHQLPGETPAAISIDLSSNATDSIFRPGIQHQNGTKKILALFEEEKMREQVDQLEYKTDMALDDFVGYMERRHEMRRAFRSKIESNNSFVTPEGMAEGLHPEVRRVIEEHLQKRKA